MVLGLFISADVVVRVAALPAELVLFVGGHVDVLEVPLGLLVASSTLGQHDGHQRQETHRRQLPRDGAGVSTGQSRGQNRGQHLGQNMSEQRSTGVRTGRNVSEQASDHVRMGQSKDQHGSERDRLRINTDQNETE